MQLQAGRHVLARAPAGDRRRTISDRLGTEGYAFANVNAVPEIDRDEDHRGVHVLRRPGPPRLRAQDQHQRQPEDARRGDPPRDAPARGRVVRRHRASSGRRCASAGSATSRTSTSRRRRCRARPTRSTSRSRSPRRTPATCSRASATRARKASCSTRRCRSRTSSARATRWRSAINTS